MDKNSSMSNIYNYFQGFITNKTQVKKDPLEDITDTNKASASSFNYHSGNINLDEKIQKGKKLFNENRYKYNRS